VRLKVRAAEGAVTAVTGRGYASGDQRKQITTARTPMVNGSFMSKSVVERQVFTVGL
jgi:hypothetical protein